MTTLSKSIVMIAMACVFLPGTRVNAQKNTVISHTDSYSPGGFFDTAFDRFGHAYPLSQIAIQPDDQSDDPRDRTASKSSVTKTGGTSGSSTRLAKCSPGYFRLYLETGCGMDDSTNPVEVARMAVVCQVLTDISNFIPSPCTSTGQTVNLWVQRAGGGSGFLGVATPFFSLPYSPGITGITDNMIWITLNSGKDAWTNVVSPLYPSGTAASFYHGSMAFQFNGSINWHTDLSTPPVAGERDLYTVVLHELLHAMGFHTLIDYDGGAVFNPGFDYYSRYDKFLKTSAGTSLISQTGSCSQYSYKFNPSLTVSSVLSPGPAASCPSGYQTSGSTDHTNCSNAVHFSDGIINIPVYTPDCFEKGSSLSHFEDECFVPSGFPIAMPASNNQYFLMSNAGATGAYNATTNPGAMKRHPVAEERQALCDLGYKVNSTYGNSAHLNLQTYSGGVCPGLGVAGINDGISAGAYTYVSSGGTPVSITASSLIANDYGAVSVSCLEVVNGLGTITGGSGTYTYNPGTGEYGMVLLRYIPVGATGNTGNITYVYVFVGSAGCVPDACNMVTNGGFEQVVPGSSGDIVANPGIIHCWDSYTASADLFSVGGSLGNEIPFIYTVKTTYVHLLSTLPNDHFIDIQASSNNGGPDWSEGVQVPLTSALAGGQEYILSFWAKTAHLLHSAYMDNHMEFAMSESKTPLAYAGLYIHSFPAGLSLIGDYIMPTEEGEDWHYFETRFTYTGTAGTRLVIFNAPWLNVHDSDYNLMNMIDDIKITQASTAVSFHIPAVCKGGMATIDLDSTVNVPGGTFSWPGMPVTSGVPTIHNSTLLDVASASTAATATGYHAKIPVSYTYTNALGCVQTTYAYLYLLDSTVPPISGHSTVIAGDTTTFADEVYGGKWSSSNTAKAMVDPITGIVTGMSSGVATITYKVGSDCITTKTITVIASAGVTKPISGSTDLSVFPSPNNGAFTIKGVVSYTDGEGEAEIEIIDMTGRVSYRDICALDNGIIDKKVTIDKIPDGIYFVKVKTNSVVRAIRFQLKR